MADLPPWLVDPARAAWGWLRSSPVAAWALYVFIGVCGAGALVLVACDGDSHPGREPPPPVARKKVGKPGPPRAQPPLDDRADPGPLDAGPPPYQLHPDLGSAFAAIVRDDRPRVLGVGELHVRTDRPAPAVSALARFSGEVLPAIADRVSDVVVETWTVDAGCQKGQVASRQIESSMKRPASTKNEIGALFGVTRARSITAHVMRLGCDDLVALAGGDRVDAERLLATVTRELDRVTRSAVRYRDEHHEARPLIVVYGGALHNDLYPYASTKQWSYALGVDEATGGRFIEVDLYAPELIEGDPLYEGEPWYPLVARADSRGVMLIERLPRSYLAILPRS